MTTNISSLTNNIKIISNNMQNFSSVSLGIWIEVGSRNEIEDEQGISHLLEHMAFKGTKSRSSKQIALEIENVGGDINASTSVERTNYYVRLLENDLEIGVSILSDIIQNSIFDPNELKKEKSVILQELAATLDSPDDMVFENFQSAAYHDQAIGRSILGNKETLLNIDSTKLITYLNKFYHADNIIIVATGAVNHEKLHSLCEKYLSNIESTDSPRTNIASYRPNEIREIRNIEQAHIIYAFEGCSYHDSQLYVSHVFSNILGGGMSSRLFQNIRENQGLAYSIFSFSSSYKDTGVFGIYSATSPDKVNDYSISVAQEIKNSASNISEEEIQKAKKQIRAGLLISSENPVARMNQIARQMSIYGKLIDMNEILEKIESIDINHINDFIETTFKPEKMTISALGAISKLDEITKIQRLYE
jgi:predicted Zn-dependent peptidase